MLVVKAVSYVTVVGKVGASVKERQITYAISVQGANHSAIILKFDCNHLLIRK